jgi:predicted PurR-regulated permease PerM
VTERSRVRADDAGPGTDRVLLLGLILLVTGVLAWLAGDVLLVVFAGILLAVALDGMASGLSRLTGLPQKAALVLVALASLAAVAGVAVLVVPTVVGQIDDIRRLFVSAAESGRATLARWGWAEELADLAEVDSQQVIDMAGGVAGRVAGMTLTAFSVAASLFVALAIAIFAAFDPALYRRGTLALLPARRRPRVDRALSAVARSLRWWFLGQLVSMAVLAVTVSAGLWVIGVDLWLSLGVLTGVLTFIPILGPVIAGIPILVVSFAQGTGTGITVLVFYLIVQNLEGNFLVPWIQHQVVHLPPAVLITAQVLLGALLGIAGFILAAPLAVVAMVLVQKLWVERGTGPEN